MKHLKKRIKNGDTLIGCWLNLGNSITAEITGLAGFDWVLIDLEHGSGTENDLLYQLQALQHTPAAPVVRIEGASRQRIHRVLDLGAEGVMVPRINNPEEAGIAALGLHYPPEGNRGVARMVRATGFGQDFGEYLSNSRDEVVGIIQVETVEVLEHLDEIAALNGIDVLFIGPSDLSMALGKFGSFDHPLYIDAVKMTVNAAQKRNKAAGILLPGPEDFRTYHEMGVRLFAGGSDATFVADGAKSMYHKLDSLRSVNNKQP